MIISELKNWFLEFPNMRFGKVEKKYRPLVKYQSNSNIMQIMHITPSLTPKFWNKKHPIWVVIVLCQSLKVHVHAKSEWKNNADHVKTTNIPFLFQIWLVYPTIKTWNFKKLGFSTSWNLWQNALAQKNNKNSE